MTWAPGRMGDTVVAVVTRATWVLLGLATPLALAGELGLPTSAVALLLGAFGALAITVVGRHVNCGVDAPRGPGFGPAVARPLLSSRIPDPVHHPVRPRAPGPV